MHHTPAVVMGSARRSNEGLRSCWWFACLEENINPRRATRLPLLFALDRKLGIPDGFVYAPDCNDPRLRDKYGSDGATVHCGGEFGSTRFDGSTDGFGDTAGGSGGGHGDGAHGCSGGCSGGCGGGD